MRTLEIRIPRTTTKIIIEKIKTSEGVNYKAVFYKHNKIVRETTGRKEVKSFTLRRK